MSLAGPDLKASIALIDGLNVDASDGAFEQLASALQRLNDEQKANYQTYWVDMEARIERASAQDLPLPDLLAAAEGVAATDGLIPDFIMAKNLRIDTAAWQAAPGHQIVVRDGVYGLVAAAEARTPYLIERLAPLVGADTQAVIELGCGWGRNLVRLSQSLRRPDLTYIGCEQSGAGRRVTARLLGHDASVRYAVHDFDFFTMGFTPDSVYDEAVVFTSAALEQVTFMPPGFLDYVRGFAKRVRVVLFEPFGWQRVPQLDVGAVRQFLLEINGQAPTYTRDGYVFRVIGDMLDQNAAAWSVYSAYNMNLYPLIRRAVDAGGFTLSHMAFNVWGPNLFNPYSLAVLDSE